MRKQKIVRNKQLGLAKLVGVTLLICIHIAIAVTYTHNVNDITAVQTSNSPLNVSASSTHTAYYPYYIFDHVGNSFGGWASLNGDTMPGWIVVDFGAGNEKIFIGCNLSAWSGGNSVRLDGSFAFQGSNDNANWTNLLSLTNVAAFSDSEMRQYNWSNTTAYRYFKFIKTVGQYDPYIAELEIFAAPIAQSSLFLIF